MRDNIFHNNRGKHSPGTSLGARVRRTSVHTINYWPVLIALGLISGERESVSKLLIKLVNAIKESIAEFSPFPFSSRLFRPPFRFYISVAGSRVFVYRPRGNAPRNADQRYFHPRRLFQLYQPVSRSGRNSSPPLLFLSLFLSPLLAYAVTVCGGNSRGVTTSNVRVDVYAVATVYRNPIEARLL